MKFMFSARCFIFGISLWLPVATAQKCSDLDGSIIITESFDTIDIGLKCDGSIKVPSAVHWHVTEVEGGGENGTTTVNMSPPNVVQPNVSSSTLFFEVVSAFEGSDDVGIEVMVPRNMLKKVEVIGVKARVALSLTSEIRIRDIGADNRILATSTDSVTYEATGVDSDVQISATDATLSLTGTGADVRVKGNVPSATISGINSKLLVEGEATVNVQGVSNNVRVNGAGGCGDVSESGIDNTCKETTDNVTITELDCTTQADSARGNEVCISAGETMKAITVTSVILMVVALIV